jgi:hypothetical protein
MTSACSETTPPSSTGGTIAPTKRVYTGSRAEQVISGMMSIVVSRSCQEGMTRVERIAGTAQANPPISGNAERPCSPKRPRNRSTKNAALAK